MTIRNLLNSLKDNSNLEKDKLLLIIEMLVDKIELLEKPKYNNKNSELINRLSRLYIPNLSYIDFINTIKIKDINLFFDNFNGTLTNILIQSIKACSTNIPITLLQHKPKTLFIFNNTWVMCRNSDLEKINDFISKQLLKLITIWQKDNIVSLTNDTIYNKFYALFNNILSNKNKKITLIKNILLENIEFTNI